MTNGYSKFDDDYSVFGDADSFTNFDGSSFNSFTLTPSINFDSLDFFDGNSSQLQVVSCSLSAT